MFVIWETTAFKCSLLRDIKQPHQANFTNNSASSYLYSAKLIASSDEFGSFASHKKLNSSYLLEEGLAIVRLEDPLIWFDLDPDFVVPTNIYHFNHIAFFQFTCNLTIDRWA